MSQHIIDLDKSPLKKAVTKKPAAQSSSKKYQAPPTQPWTKKRKVLAAAGSLLLVGALSLTVIYSMQQSKPASQSVIPTPQPTPTPEVPSQPNPLNGLLYTKEQAAAWANRRPLAVMVENHLQARPQSGLNQAEVLYEAMAEGGITRTMAVYLANSPAKIGPVRSARLHFISWASEYDALYAHWGGSDEALHYLQNNNRPRDIDQFRHAAAFYRDYSGGRSLEHTGYTSSEALRQVASQKGWEQLSTFRSWKFKDDLESAQRPTEQVVDLSMLGQSDYTIQFTYQPQTNNYLRATGGRPHLDASDQQLQAKTIILQFQTVRPYTDQAGHPAVDVTTVGTGKAVVIQDGQATPGTWSKSSHATRTIFSDTQGREISLNRGLVWIISVPNGSSYSY